AGQRSRAQQPCTGPTPFGRDKPGPTKSTRRAADGQWRGTTAGGAPVGPALCRPAEPGTTPARWINPVGRDEPGPTQQARRRPERRQSRRPWPTVAREFEHEATGMPYADLCKGRGSLPGQIYHLTLCTHERHPWFEDIQLACIVVAQRRRLQTEAQRESLAWPLMPDHPHWLVRRRSGLPMSASIRIFKGRSTFATRGACQGRRL